MADGERGDDAADATEDRRNDVVLGVGPADRGAEILDAQLVRTDRQREYLVRC